MPERAAAFVFGAACLVGLAGAFVGLRASSFSVDELFTGWVIGDGDPAHVLSRAVTDVHPPLYYLLLAAVSRATGTDEIGLRVFSAVCAVGAILTFVLGTPRAFSLTGRLFAATLATGSYFWFYQSQNARSYALAMLIGAGLVVITLRLLRHSAEGQPPSALDIAGLAFACLAESSIHFYGLLVAGSALLALSVAIPTRRMILLGAAVAIAMLGVLYIELVLRRFVQQDVSATWIGSNVAWYRTELINAVLLSLNRWAKVAIGICVVVAAIGLWSQRTTTLGRRPATTALLVCASVPAMVLFGAVLSSVIFAPNFTDQNLLLASPFIWAALAALYDLSIGRAPVRINWVANAALSICALLAASGVTARGLPRNDPIRESAAWIERTFPGCRGETLLALAASARPPGREKTYNVPTGDYLYSNYLVGFASAHAEYLTDVPTDAATVARLHNRGKQRCPVVAWSARHVTPDAASTAATTLFPIVASPMRVMTFRTYGDTFPPRLDGPTAFVIYARPSG